MYLYFCIVSQRIREIKTGFLMVKLISIHVLLLLAGFGNITSVEIKEACGSIVQTRITRDKGKFQQYFLKFLPLKKPI